MLGLVDHLRKHQGGIKLSWEQVGMVWMWGGCVG